MRGTLDDTARCHPPDHTKDQLKDEVASVIDTTPPTL